MIRPTLDLAVAFKRVSREAEEWFDFPPDDRFVADLLVAAAAGGNVERQLVDVLRGRQTPSA